MLMDLGILQIIDGLIVERAYISKDETVVARVKSVDLSV